MTKIISRFFKFLFKTAIIAALTRWGLLLAKKINTKESRNKIDELIDEKAEVAKDLAKSGAHKSFDKLDEVVWKADEIETKGKFITKDFTSKNKDLKKELVDKITKFKNSWLDLYK